MMSLITALDVVNPDTRDVFRTEPLPEITDIGLIKVTVLIKPPNDPNVSAEVIARNIKEQKMVKSYYI